MDQPIENLPRSGLIRPFLAHIADPGATVQTPPTPEPTPIGAGMGVRAYMMTGGRTGSGAVKLEFEAMLSLTDQGRNGITNLVFERRKIAQTCLDGPQSVAEIAAKVHLPLGVVQVIAGDMVGDSLLNPHRSNAKLSDDVAMLKRLIQGVRAL